MPIFERRLSLPHSPELVWAYHMRPGAFGQLSPPWEPINVLHWDGVFDGAKQVFEIDMGIKARWEAVIDEFVEGKQFRDRQVSGPFPHWNHTHRIEPNGDGAVLVDHIDYALPLGAVGAAAGGWYAAKKLERMWSWRHHRMTWDLRRIAVFADQEPSVVAVTGATGFVGSKLCDLLRLAGHEVRRVVRRPDSDADICWAPSKGEIEADKLEGVDVVIHLAGAPISVRWTDHQMALIRDSRVQGTDLLARTLAAMKRKPRVLLSGSAVGFYGYDGGDAVKTEQAEQGTGFAAGLCGQWEAAADPARDAGITVIHPRIGVVLSPDGAALAKMLPAFRAGGGGPIGSGTQYFPWITAQDVVAALHFLAFTPGLEGAFNAVSPSACPQREFAKALGGALGRPAILPAPAFALRVAMGQMATELVIGGQNVVPARLEAAGFAWENPDVQPALERVLGVPRS